MAGEAVFGELRKKGNRFRVITSDGDYWIVDNEEFVGDLEQGTHVLAVLQPPGEDGKYPGKCMLVISPYSGKAITSIII